MENHKRVGWDCLADVALQGIQALLSVILVDNGATGVDELLQLLTVNSLYSSLNCLVAHVVCFLSNGHGLLARQDSVASGLDAVEANEDGLLVSSVALLQHEQQP